MSSLIDAKGSLGRDPFVCFDIERNSSILYGDILSDFTELA